MRNNSQSHFLGDDDLHHREPETVSDSPGNLPDASVEALGNLPAEGPTRTGVDGCRREKTGSAAERLKRILHDAWRMANDGEPWPLLALALLLGGCSAEPEVATRVLRASGFAEIRLGEYPWFECGEHDLFNSSFTAVGPTGNQAVGAVCCGLWRNCTVRLR